MKRTLPNLGELFAQLAQDLGLKCKDIETLHRRYKCEGVAFLTKTLPSLAKALDASFRTGQFQCPSNFKCRKGTLLPCFMGSVFGRIFTRFGVLREDACPVAVYVARQFLFFAYKLEMPYKSIDELAVATRFITTERELSKMKIVDDAITNVASFIVAEIFSDFDPVDLDCKHGPGVTANCDQMEKFEQELDPSLPVVGAFEEHFFFNDNDRLFGSDILPGRSYRLQRRKHVDFFRSTGNVARVILVPKDSRGPRLISCEPVENMFVQQGIFRYMKRKLESHPLSSGYVNFTDQGVNRHLAREASLSQEYSTLDLKDASDRVHCALVQRLFNRAPALLAALMTARSEKSHLALKKAGQETPWFSETVTLSKFAPMGSATCFSVLSTVCYVLVLSSIVGITGDINEALGTVYVYGDDIIVKTEYARLAMDVLERYGLLVNRDKSFVAARFAESCGLDAFDGNDVSPIRLRKWHTTKVEGKPNPDLTQWLPSLIATAKHCSASGLCLTAEMLYRTAEAYLGKLPWGSHGSPYLSRWTWRNSLIPEMNAYTARLKWKAEADLNRYPHGAQLRAWKIQPVSDNNEFTTGYGHMQRTWPLLGGDSVEAELLPEFGVFTLPKQVLLRRGLFDHYAMT